MTKIKLTLITAAYATIMLSSCQFSEDCQYKGNVELAMDWESLWGNLEKPDSLTAIFYSQGNPVKKSLLGDTIYENIPAGENELFTYNYKPNEIECKGLERAETAELHLPTYFTTNGTRAVNECPLICTTKTPLTVPIDGTVKQIITPEPIVKQLAFIVHIEKKGITGQVKSCNASLSGIATGYSLFNKTATRSKETTATVFFPLKEKEEDSFSHSFFVMGVNPTTTSEDIISKKLTVNIVLDDGESRAADLDLTEQLDLFAGNAFKCELTVTISALSTNIIIKDWQQGHWEEISIQ